MEINMTNVSNTGSNAVFSTDQVPTLIYGEQPPSREVIIERNGQLGQNNVTLIMVTPKLLDKFEKEIEDLVENTLSPEKSLVFMAIGVCLCVFPFIGASFLGFGIPTFLALTLTCIPVAFVIPISYCIYKHHQITQYKDCFHTLQNHPEYLNSVIANTLFGNDISTQPHVKQKIDEFREKPINLHEDISTLVQLHGMCKKIVQLEANTRKMAKFEFAFITYTLANHEAKNYEKTLEETPIHDKKWSLLPTLQYFDEEETYDKDHEEDYDDVSSNIKSLRQNYLNDMDSIRLNMIKIV